MCARALRRNAQRLHVESEKIYTSGRVVRDDHIFRRELSIGIYEKDAIRVVPRDGLVPAIVSGSRPWPEPRV